jgi:hypothetical protein
VNSSPTWSMSWVRSNACWRSESTPPTTWKGGAPRSWRAQGCNTGDGVIVLTDMFGGTPSNLAISIMEQARIEVLAGVNLPMLVKLASVRTQPIAEAVRMAEEAGRKYITVASRLPDSRHPQ